MKKRIKKLQLRRETVRRLLGGVSGREPVPASNVCSDYLCTQNFGTDCQSYTCAQTCGFGIESLCLCAETNARRICM